jgi:hypothetical protein
MLASRTMLPGLPRACICRAAACAPKSTPSSVDRQSNRVEVVFADIGHRPSAA